MVSERKPFSVQSEPFLLYFQVNQQFSSFMKNNHKAHGPSFNAVLSHLETFPIPSLFQSKNN